MNPAARLHRIYDQLAGQTHDRHMVQTWADVFDIDQRSPHVEDDVTSCLMALRAEIDLTRQKLGALGVPDELTSPGFERLRNVAAPGLLNSSWNQQRGNIQPPECRKVFEWAAWVLRDETEPDMSSEQMDALRSELTSLEDALQNTEMSQYLKDFIQRQVETIRAALRLYGVQGARPLQDALQKVAGAYTVERGRIEQERAAAPEPAKSVLSRASGFIDRTAKVCDGMSKIGKFGEQAWSLAGTVGPLVLPYVQRVLG